MALAPALDLRPQEGDPRFKHPPNDIGIEQAVLGCLLYDEDTYHQLPDALREEHFYEPFHGRLFAAIQSASAIGRRVDPTLLAKDFERDGAYNELGGVRYLADLVDRAPPSYVAAEYAKELISLASRREVLKVAADMIARAEAGGSENAPGDIISEAETRMIEITRTGKSASAMVSIGASAAAAVAYAERVPEPTDFKATTGLAPIDLRIGPMIGEALIIIAARPSMGKSALLLSVSKGIAAPELIASMNGMSTAGLPRPRGVLELHGEMTFNDKVDRGGGQVGRRHLADVGFAIYGEAFPTYEDIRNRKVTPEQIEMMRDAAAYLAHIPIVGEKRTGVTPSQLRSMVKRQIIRWQLQGIDPGAVIIDHAGLMNPDRPSGSATEDQSSIAKALMEMTDEFGLPFWVAVQLNRQVESRDDKRPQMADLKQSGAWEECADIIGFLFREAYYAERQKEPTNDGKRGGKNDLTWEAWDKARKSKAVECNFGKIREGKVGQAVLHGEMPWNVMRGHEPERKGRLL